MVKILNMNLFVIIFPMDYLVRIKVHTYFNPFQLFASIFNVETVGMAIAAITYIFKDNKFI